MATTKQYQDGRVLWPQSGEPRHHFAKTAGSQVFRLPLVRVGRCVRCRRLRSHLLEHEHLSRTSDQWLLGRMPDPEQSQTQAQIFPSRRGAAQFEQHLNGTEIPLVKWPDLHTE